MQNTDYSFQKVQSAHSTTCKCKLNNIQNALFTINPMIDYCELPLCQLMSNSIANQYSIQNL